MTLARVATCTINSPSAGDATFSKNQIVYRSCNRSSMLSLVFLGTRTEDGDDVVILNPSKIPSKREFTGKKEYNDVMDCLFL